MLLAGGPPVLQVHPSRLCNLACSHCYTSSGPTRRGELPIEMLGHALEDAVGLGYRQLAVSGGEPLLYGSLTELLGRAKALGMITTLTTNGMLATPERWRTLAPALDFAAVSIDGVPADHDRIRGRSGAFAQTLANLPEIRSSGVPFGFLFTLTQHNADSLESVVALAAEHGARSVQVHPLTLHGRARHLLPDERPDQLELLAALAEAQRLGDDLGVRIHVDSVTLEQVKAYRGELVPPRPFQATDVSPLLVIDADGRVIPLTHEVAPPFHLGSLRDARLYDLVARWLQSGAAAELARVCEETWNELTAQSGVHAFYWYDEVVARSERMAAQIFQRPRAPVQGTADADRRPQLQA